MVSRMWSAGLGSWRCISRVGVACSSFRRSPPSIFFSFEGRTPGLSCMCVSAAVKEEAMVAGERAEGRAVEVKAAAPLSPGQDGGGAAPRP